MGNVGGSLSVAPLVMVLARGRPAWTTLLRNVEFWVILGLLLASGALLLEGGIPFGWTGLAYQAAFPCLVWAGVRLGTRGAVLTSLVTLIIVTIATIRGYGPFAALAPDTSIMLLWTYRMGIAMTALTLAAVTAQRDSAEARRRRAEARREEIERQQLISGERERIMREMHDGVGGHLISALSMVERGLASPREIAEVLRRTLDDMRIVIDSLETRDISFQELIGKLRARLTPLLQRNGIQSRWAIEELAAFEHLEPEQSLHVLRFVQEASANVIQHAEASELEIRVGPGPDERIVIAIRDDGVGLAPETREGGRGIANMTKRAKMLGGVLEIESEARGTCVTLSIPASPDRR
jgi:signal transduction histidine kinase